MGPDPFEIKKLRSDQFWSGVVLIHRGIEVSRKGLLDFVAYNLGAIHSETGKYQAQQAEQMQVLHELRPMRPFHSRDNVDYALLSIARDLTAPGDIDRFLDAAKAIR